MHQIQFTFTDATQTHNSLKVFVLNDEQESVSPYIIKSPSTANQHLL